MRKNGEMEENEAHVLSWTFGPNRRGWMFDKLVGGNVRMVHGTWQPLHRLRRPRVNEKNNSSSVPIMLLGRQPPPDLQGTYILVPPRS